MNILLVENDPIICQSLRQVLEKWDHKVSCPDDLALVTEFFSTHPTDLVILDINLHKKSYPPKRIALVFSKIH